MGKDSEELIRQAAREGAKEGARAVMDALARKSKESVQERRDKRFKNAKFLLKNYRDLKKGSVEAISSVAELGEEDFDFFERLMGGGAEELTAESIVRTRARTAVIMAHVDAMLTVYKEVCDQSPRPEDRRRYRVLERLCTGPVEMTAAQIAEEDHTYEKAVYRDFDAASERMGVLLFGIPWFGLE